MTRLYILVWEAMALGDRALFCLGRQMEQISAESMDSIIARSF